MRDLIEIQARCGDAISLAAGQSISIVNTHGGQVVDMWAFRADDPNEHMSMPHSMVALDRIKPAIGSVLVSNLRKPMLTLMADTSPGMHCMRRSSGIQPNRKTKATSRIGSASSSSSTINWLTISTVASFPH